jgi:CubicO group peptidase (beta-lactamase class C family)
MGRKLIILCILTIVLSACLKDEPLKLPNNSFLPQKINDGLTTSNPESESVDNKLITDAFDLFYSKSLPFSKGLIILRNGVLIAEAYAQDKNDITRINNIQSCTKSVTALLIGKAIEDGLISSVNDPIYKYIPEYFDNNLAKRKITIRNCLTLQAGLAFEGNSDSEKMVNISGSSLKYVLKKPIIADTGATFLYSDLIPQLLAGVLNKVTPAGLERYAEAEIFSPLGIKTYKWEKTRDGINIGAFSLFLSTRDLAKLGLLCLQNGVYNNTPLINSGWITKLSTKQAINAPYGYGFYIESNGAYKMKGNGGQFVYINPLKKLVIAYTALPYTGPKLWGDTDHLINLITNACK